MAGKGSRRRPCQISTKEADLRYQLAFGTEAKKQEAMKELIKMGVLVK